MADIKWIKITTDIFDDEKIKLIDALPESDGIIVIWFKLLTLAGKINDNGNVYISKKMPITDEMLSTIFNRPLNTVRLALNTFTQFGMIEVENHINITNWEKHQNISGMEKVKLQNAERQRKYREKNKQEELPEPKKEDSNVTVTLSNGTDKIREDKNREEIELELEKNIYAQEKEVFDFWNSKQGVTKSQERSFDKGKIATAIKNYGKDSILEAINRLDQAVLDSKYYYSFKWNLFNFLKQANGIKNWLDDGQIWNDYKNQKGTGNVGQKELGENKSIPSYCGEVY